MSLIKKPQEVEMIKKGGKILASVLDQVLQKAKPGVSTQELDDLAEKLIMESGGRPAFKNFKSREDETPFPSTICASVNEQLVHTPAGNYKLQKGDILTIDIGMQYPAKGGFYTDMAKTIAIGKISETAEKLLAVTEESLKRGIAQVKPGNRISDISKAVQNYAESNGFSVVRELVGHGVGYDVHEEPRIPNYFEPKNNDVELKEGMVLAIEPMLNEGDAAIETLEDGWTIIAADRKLCAHFEHTVVVTKDGVEILTQ